MLEFKGTPGPWEAQQGFYDEEPEVWSIEGADNSVATIDSPAGTKQSMADAHAIAAVPDMIALLIKLATHLEWDSLHPGSESEIIQVLNKALKPNGTN